jgi:hypothetical protein
VGSTLLKNVEIFKEKIQITIFFWKGNIESSKHNLFFGNGIFSKSFNYMTNKVIKL